MSSITPEERAELEQLRKKHGPLPISTFKPLEGESYGKKVGSQPSLADSVIRGAASSVFAPEITAAVESALGSLGVTDDKTYQEALKETQALYDKAEKKNPGAYTLGQIAPVVVALVAGPAAAAGKAAVQRSSLGRFVSSVKAAAKDGKTAAVDVVSASTGLPKDVVNAGIDLIGDGMLASHIPGAKAAMTTFKGTKNLANKALDTAKKLTTKKPTAAAKAAPKPGLDELSEGLRTTRARGRLSDVDDDLMELIGKAQKAPAPTPSAKASNVLEARDAAAGGSKAEAARRLADPSYASRASTWETHTAKAEAKSATKPKIFDKERAKLDSELDAKEGRTLSILEQLRKAPAPKKGR